MEKQYKTFSEFYPYYLGEHSKTSTKIFHFIGTGLVVFSLLYVLFTQTWSAVWIVPLCGYGFAWIGHFFFEKNRPATFTYPLFSLMGDFAMFKDLLTGKIKF